ncbi:MAG: hypothetical protein HY720_07005 [Planctomycetes bacterium]|nr:hypothetical protein [Planctomycetota bacterium]
MDALAVLDGRRGDLDDDPRHWTRRLRADDHHNGLRGGAGVPSLQIEYRVDDSDGAFEDGWIDDVQLLADPVTAATAGVAFENLKVDKTGGALNVAANVTVRKDLTVTNGTFDTSVDAESRTVTVQGAFSVAATGVMRVKSADVLDLTRAKRAFPPDTHTIAGTLDMVGGDGTTNTTVKLGDRQQLVVTGRIMTSPNVGYNWNGRRIDFTRSGGSGGYSIHVADGGFVDMQFVKFDYLYARSSNSNETTEATVERGFAFTGDKSNIAILRFLWFDNAVDGGAPANSRYPRYMYFLVDDADDLNGLGSVNLLTQVHFDNASALANQRNVEKQATGDTITFYNVGGAVGGESFDMDGYLDDGVTPGPDPSNTGIDDIDFGTNPTAVTLDALAATGYDATVLLDWRTGQEVDNLGFNVYRSRFPDRDWVQVNPAMILGLGDSPSGGRYYFLDGTVTNGVRYYYMLEDVDERGTRTLSGPVSAVPEAGAGSPVLDDSLYTNHGSTGDEPESDTVPTPGPDEPPPETGDGRPNLAERLLGIDLASAGIRLLSYDESGAVIEILPPAPTLLPEVWEGRLETRIEMAGYSSTRTMGKPIVPEKNVLLVTPGILRARVEILAAESRSLSGIDLVRARPPPASVAGPAPRAGAGRAPPANGREDAGRGPPSYTEMLLEARRDLLERLAREREVLLAARREARHALLSLGRRGGNGEPKPAPPAERRGGRAPDGAGEAGRVFPGELVGLGSFALYGGRQLLPLAIHPVQADAGGRRAEVYRRIVARIVFLGRLPRPDEDPLSGPEGLDTPAQIALAADGSALKVRVRRDGVYRLTRGELAAAGLDVTVDPRTIQVFHLGREIPAHVSGEIDGVFDEGDELLFYGRKNPWRDRDNPETTRYTDENVYWIAAGKGFGRRMEEVWVDRADEGAPAGRECGKVLHLEDNWFFQPKLEDGEGRDHWFDRRYLYNTRGGARPTARVTMAFDLPDLAASPHDARVTVALAGVAALSIAPDHRVVVSLNGQVLGSCEWDAFAAHRETFEVPSALLLATGNVLELRVPVDLPGADYDFVFVNYARLEYRGRILAREDRVAFEGDAPGVHEAAGFSEGRVLGIETSDPQAPRLVRGLVAEGGTVRFDDRVAGTGGKYLFVGPGGFLSPEGIERNSPSSWHDEGNGAAWVAIAHPDVALGARTLAAYRGERGLTTAVALIEDLYDEWTAGIPDPRAIRAFLAWARGRWREPPRYALLAGDATYDPHGYHFPAPDLVPAQFVQMEYIWAPSDAWFAAVEGGDMVPDLALGRLPARSEAQMSAAIEQLLEHEQGFPGDWRGRATFAADRTDGYYDFAGASGEFARIAGSSLATELVDAGALGAAEARRRVRVALDEGRLLVGYMGHGNAWRWGGGDLLPIGTVPLLANEGRYGLVTAMGCLNGQFVLPDSSSMGEALVFAERRGAFAFWGSTAAVAPAPQDDVYRELLRVLFLEETERTLGEAVLEANVRVWADWGGNEDVIASWVLFGDPASPLVGLGE